MRKRVDYNRMDSKKKTKQSQMILEAAYKCISKKGYANVSLREIAKEAGVVLSQLHYYYGSKEGLFREVVKAMVERYTVELEKCLKNGVTAKEKATSLIQFFKNMLANNPGLFRLLYDFTGLALWSSSFKDQLSSLFRELSEMIEKYVINTADESEQLEGYSSRSLARMILATMFGTVMQVLLDPEEENLPDALNGILIIFG